MPSVFTRLPGYDLQIPQPKFAPIETPPTTPWASLIGNLVDKFTEFQRYNSPEAREERALKLAMGEESLKEARLGEQGTELKLKMEREALGGEQSPDDGARSPADTPQPGATPENPVSPAGPTQVNDNLWQHPENGQWYSGDQPVSQVSPAKSDSPVEDRTSPPLGIPPMLARPTPPSGAPQGIPTATMPAAGAQQNAASLTTVSPPESQPMTQDQIVAGRKQFQDIMERNNLQPTPGRLQSGPPKKQSGYLNWKYVGDGKWTAVSPFGMPGLHYDSKMVKDRITDPETGAEINVLYKSDQPDQKYFNGFHKKPDESRQWIQAMNSGDSVYEKLPKAYQNNVDQVAQYSADVKDFNRLFTRNGEAAMAMRAAVKERNPYWEERNYPILAGMLDPKSVVGRTIDSGNKVIQHLKEMDESVDKMDDVKLGPIDSRATNATARFLSKQKGKDAVTNFETARNAVSDELTKFFAGGAGSEADRERWLNTLSSAGSKAQLKGAIRGVLPNLLAGQMIQYDDGWYDKAHTAPPEGSFIRSRSRDVLKDWGVKLPPPLPTMQMKETGSRVAPESPPPGIPKPAPVDPADLVQRAMRIQANPAATEEDKALAHNIMLLYGSKKPGAP